LVSGWQDVDVASEGHPTPEAAALAEFEDIPQAQARVVSVEYLSDDEAVVVTDTLPSHRMSNHCFRSPDGWVVSYDHN
jgi:hypothetical protein